MSKPFLVDPSWTATLRKLGANPKTFLRLTNLPHDLLARPRPALETQDFTLFWQALTDAFGIGTVIDAADQTASPSVFAALCSPNLTAATRRIAVFKPFTGPVQWEVHDTLGGLEITLGPDAGTSLPPAYITFELAQLAMIARRATGTEVRPIAVEMTSPPKSKDTTKLFGRAVQPGPFNRVVFTREDAKRPFTAHDTPFDPAMGPQPETLTPNAPLSEKVQAVLRVSLAAGQGTTQHVAAQLGTSVRGLQRKLAGQNTSFKDELQNCRAQMARHLLATSAMNNAEIAFMLGYEDPNSFIRAFHGWTGTPPETYRKSLNA